MEIFHQLSETVAATGANLQDRPVEYDKYKVDEVVLALLFLTLHDECRARKDMDWGAMERLHEKGMIEDPVGKAKSVVLTEAGLAQCRADRASSRPGSKNGAGLGSQAAHAVRLSD